MRTLFALRIENEEKFECFATREEAEEVQWILEQEGLRSFIRPVQGFVWMSVAAWKEAHECGRC